MLSSTTPRLGAQMAAGDGKGTDQGWSGFFSQPGELRLRDLHQVRMVMYAAQQFRQFR